MAKDRQPCPDCGGHKPSGAGKRACAPCQHRRTSEARQRARLAARKRAAARIAKRRAAEGKPLLHPLARANAAPVGRKWCNRCERYRSQRFFGSSGSRSAAYCKPCASAYYHSRRLATVWGITSEEYETVLLAQDGACYMCRRRMARQRLAVDHDHDHEPCGGKGCRFCIRALLCKNCNHRILGFVGDDPDVLQRGIDVILRHPAQAVLNP